MDLHGTKTSPEFCLTACAWKEYPVPAQMLHTSYEAHECQDAYPANVSHWNKLFTLRIMEYQFSRKLSSSSGGKIWNHLETGDLIIGESDFISYCIGSTRQHYDHCGGLQGQPFWGAAICLTHIAHWSQLQWTQGTAETRSQSGGTSWKTLKKKR